MMLALLLAAVAQVAVVPLPSTGVQGVIIAGTPADRAIAARSAPPVVTLSETDRLARRLDRLLVTVEMGTDTLWSGMLLVNGAMSAGYDEAIRNAAVPVCSDPARTAESGSELHVNLSKSGGVYTRKDEYRIAVRVVRSFPPPACTGIASRSMGLDEFVSVPVGGQTSVDGDAGLRVRLVRLESLDAPPR